MSSRFSLEAILTLTDNMTSQFKKAATNTTAISQRMQQQIVSMNQGVNRLLRIGIMSTAIQIGVASTAVIKFTKDVAASGDELAKTGRQIGWTAEGLQELRFAADRQGVTSEILTGSLEKLNKNVGDLRANTGALKTILNQTNPEFAKQLLNVKTNEEAFNLLVSEIGRLPNQMDKAALSQAAFGRSGQDMLKLIEAGPDGIAALRQEARSYGLISNEAATASEAFVDAQTNLKAVINGLKNELATGVIPIATEYLSKLKDYIITNKELIRQKIIDHFQNIANNIKTAIPYIKSLVHSFLKISDTFRKWAPVLKKVLVLFGLYTAAIKIFMAAQLVMNIMKAVQAFAALAKAQGILNALMYANPAGLIVLGIMALIAVIAIAIKNYEEFGSLLLRSLGPIGMLVDQIMFIKTAWNEVKAAFQDEGFWGGMAEIFKQWFEWLVKPIKEVWNMIQQIGQAMGGEGRDARITRREERQTERQGQRQERRQEAMLATQANAVRQERIVEEQNQRYDLYLHAPAAGYAMSQAGQAPSQAIQLGRQ